ncbi:MAG: DUF1009 domain-containing protein [Hyphomicrobiaceae bacterium]|nr:MAG: DUF1009 domain-containing protein [Hyphomicrobiaceae bacterium]
MSTIGILAGGGRLPLMIAESVTARGGRVHIVAIDGEADRAIDRFPHTWVNWGQIGRMVAALRKAGCRQIVIAGGVKRPDLRKVRPDIGFFASLPRLVGFLAGGDDSVLTRVVRFFEQKGFDVRGAHQVAPDLLAGAGRMGSVELSEQGRADARLGFAVRSALGPLDAGQAVVIAQGRVLAVEGAEGTDAMLQRVAALPGRSLAAVRSGVLAKGPKPGQELRVDMPAIGPRTVERAAAVHLEGIAVEADAVLILDRADALEAADASGCAIEGLMGGACTPRPSSEGAPLGKLVRVIGRHRPGRRDAADIGKGLAVCASLAPFATGGAVVVSRAYILAIEAGEGVPAMLERVGALRQWGLKGKRRVGVLVRRIDAAGGDGPDLRALLGLAAAQGLAGVAAVGPAAAVAAYEGAARLADELGLFVVTCDAA